jgi:Tol biopolymer transport system component
VFQPQIYVGQLAARGTRVGPVQRLTDDEADDLVSAWTADSKAVVFTSNRNGKSHLFKQEIRQNEAEPVAAGP